MNLNKYFSTLNFFLKLYSFFNCASRLLFSKPSAKKRFALDDSVIGGITREFAEFLPNRQNRVRFRFRNSTCGQD